MLTNAGEVTLKLNVSQFQCHLDTCSAMLVPASHCLKALKYPNSVLNTSITSQYGAVNVYFGVLQLCLITMSN